MGLFDPLISESGRGKKKHNSKEDKLIKRKNQGTKRKEKKKFKMKKKI